MLVPELATLPLPGEQRSTCNACAMVPAPDDPDAGHDKWFLDQVRCCSYHPKLANFQVGRALLDGGSSRERMIARLKWIDGVSPLGIVAPDDWNERYQKSYKTGFGRMIDLRCPYWAGGELACGIWRARGAVCRTYHCKPDDGLAGLKFWNALKFTMIEVENRLALLCCRTGKVPQGRQPFEVWVTWFEWCAGKIASLDLEEARKAAGDKIPQLRRQLREHAARLGGEMPDVLGPAVRDFERLASGRTRLTGYSSRDDHFAGPATFALLSNLDGVTPWREALARAEAQHGAPIGEERVRDLWRMGMLRQHGEGDRPPIDEGHMSDGAPQTE